MRYPRIGADDFDCEIFEPRTASDQISRFHIDWIDIIGELRRHKVPQSALVHRTEKRRDIVIDHPIHDGRSMLMTGRQLGTTKDDAVVARKRAVTNHLCADRITDNTSRAISSDKIRALHQQSFARNNVPQFGHDALFGLDQRSHFRVERHGYPWKRRCVLAQNLLKHVLRYPLGLLRVEIVTFTAAIKCILKTRQFGTIHSKLRKRLSGDSRRTSGMPYEGLRLFPSVVGVHAS